jgi:ABC-type antimicrobial peptide transport system permease subunit
LLSTSAYPVLISYRQRAQFDTTISGQTLFARLAGFFGLLAVVLVATGLYGTLAYRVSMRTAEIGVRMAVGARREQVVWMILQDSLLLTAVGRGDRCSAGDAGGSGVDVVLVWREAL